MRKIFFNKSLLKSLVIVLVVSIFSVGFFNSNASAECYQYSSTGTMITSATPVFNNFCNVPYNINNESNFVRIRQNVSGNDMNNVTNPPYISNSLSSICAVGSTYDIWNYLHNNASPNFNPDHNPSDPSAVAHNVQENLSATFGKGTHFTFSDIVSASNANTVQASATLNCGNNNVEVNLVPASVHIYSLPYGWLNLSDSTINGGQTKVGSPIAGSGDMWGCWNYRMVIVYQIVVTAVPPTPTVTPVCKLITLESQGQVAKLEGLDYSLGSATLNSVTISFGNGASSIVNLTPSQVASLQTSPYVYTYSQNGNYSVKATINTSMGDYSSVQCIASVNVSIPTTPTTPTPPTTTPTSPTTPTTPTPPSKLVNTGPGDVIGIFMAFVLAGIFVGYRLFNRKTSVK